MSNLIEVVNVRVDLMDHENKIHDPLRFSLERYVEKYDQSLFHSKVALGRSLKDTIYIFNRVPCEIVKKTLYVYGLEKSKY
ncbi:hypothetical protein Lal_00042628 [Lupinus albus]|nr:hypothetical protein Lal_00042628 [Lupinus albus]